MGSTDPENGFPQLEEMILSNHLTGNAGGECTGISHIVAEENKACSLIYLRRCKPDYIFKPVSLLAGNSQCEFPTHSCHMLIIQERFPELRAGVSCVTHVTFSWEMWSRYTVKGGRAKTSDHSRPQFSCSSDLMFVKMC